MTKFLKEYKFPLIGFAVWRTSLFLIAFAATLVIPKWGGWFPYSERVLSITGLPSWVWGFGNFDGVHYLKIAQNGYTAMFSEAFFPLYPLLIKFFNFLPKNPGLDKVVFVDPSYFLTGLFLSNLFFLAGLILFYALIKKQFSQKIARTVIILLLIFPTSFYFGSIYTESLFFLLSTIFLFSLVKKKYLLASLFLGLVSAVKVIGILWLVVFVINLFKAKKIGKLFLYLPICFSGLISYMFFLGKKVGDPLFFLTAQPMFGAERSAKPFVLLPQVFFRYIKIFLSVDPNSLSFFVAFIEILAVIGALALLISSFKKIKFSYWFFSLLVILLPTLTGTFSSMPRYVLSAFLLLPALTIKSQKIVRVVFIGLSIILVSLFTRGYWVS